jgi:sarcosine oxidase / L-pipecolate oxidase
MPLTQPQTVTYNIIGSGVFGASTALHLIRKYPKALIRLIDRQPFPCRLAASWDWNKAVRADYGDLMSMKLALEAKARWADDDVFKPFYHQSGLIWITATKLARTIVSNYEKLGANEDCALVSVAEAKKLYDGIFEDAAYKNVEEVLVNKSSGWGEAKEALEATIKVAVEAGVKYVVGDASALLFDNDGACVGVRLASGEILTATKNLMCTGGYTAKLLSDSAPDREELQAGKRLVGAAILTGMATLSEEQATKFETAPVCCQEVLPGYGRTD